MTFDLQECWIFLDNQEGESKKQDFTYEHVMACIVHYRKTSQVCITAEMS